MDATLVQGLRAKLTTMQADNERLRAIERAARHLSEALLTQAEAPASTLLPVADGPLRATYPLVL